MSNGSSPVANGTDTVVHVARRVLTMDPACPVAEAVAVRDGRVLHTGSVDEVLEWTGLPRSAVDTTFANLVLVPGLMDVHMHSQANGGVWRRTWVGFLDRTAPDGRTARGCATVDAVVDRLRDAAATTPDGPIGGWGYDPVFLGGRPLTRAELDRVSATRPVVVMNASGHLAYANSVALAAGGVDEHCDVPGVVKDADGRPTGELHEFAAMTKVPGTGITATPDHAGAAWDGARLAHLAGCTTVADIGHAFAGSSFEQYRAAADDPAFPVRTIVSPFAMGLLATRSVDEAIGRVRDARDAELDKFRIGPVKFMLDGSIQGYTGLLQWPGYCAGEDHGMLNVTEKELREQLLPFHRAGLQIAIHTNGDEAIEIGLRALQHVLELAPRPDHRHRLEHCQMASPAQFRKMAALGVCANLFSNHVYFWGDVHRTRTMGPDKARRIDAAGTALRLGVAISLHCDAPVTPVAPLFTMWCAVNRLTQSGHVLGPNDRLTAAQALHAMTLGAAHLVHLDHELGSIEVGKRADFTVLGADPLAVDPTEIKDVPVWGTVLGGTLQPVAAGGHDRMGR